MLSFTVKLEYFMAIKLAIFIYKLFCNFNFAVLVYPGPSLYRLLMFADYFSLRFAPTTKFAN